MNKISFIICTLNRRDDLIKLLLSISNQSIHNFNFEVIVLDQNPIGYLSNLNSFCPRFNLIHIHSSRKGISYNRNLGLLHATGDILCFPDDDCTLEPSTISNVISAFAKYQVGFIGGRILSSVDNSPVLRRWPTFTLNFNKFNFYFITTSITIFIRKDICLLFDENLGAPSNYGSCEDVDLVYRMLKHKISGVYTPSVILYHPPPDNNKINPIKVKNYAAGLGFFISNNIDFYKFLLFLILFIYKIFNLIIFLFGKGNYYKFYFRDFFSGLIFGIRKK